MYFCYLSVSRDFENDVPRQFNIKVLGQFVKMLSEQDCIAKGKAILLKARLEKIRLYCQGWVNGHYTAMAGLKTKGKNMTVHSKKTN